MTDYLELLLALWEEDKEEREVLSLAEEEAGGFRGKKRAGGGDISTKVSRETAAPDGWAASLPDDWNVSATDGGRFTASDLGKTLSADSTETLAADSRKVFAARGREAIRLALSEALRKTDSGTGQQRERRGADRTRTMGTLPLEDLLSLVPLARAVQMGERSPYWPELSDGRLVPAAGAAMLERRLTEQSLAAAPTAPARGLFVSEPDGTAPMADWAEFDRRLERDARRYDGGMGIY